MYIEGILPPLLLAALSSYLLGSISFSIIFTAVFRRVDVRSAGSGNAGTTNVLRTAGKLPALLTLLFDFLKAVAAVLLSLYIFSLFPVAIPHMTANAEAQMLTLMIKYYAGLFCMLGHIYPVYFGFRGGRGVISAAGVFLLVDWRVFIIAISIFILTVVLFRMVSLGSVCAAASLPVLTCIFGAFSHDPGMIVNTLMACVIAFILIIKHSDNIRRIRNGTESKLSFGSSKK